MLLTPKQQTFNHMAHSLFAGHPKGNALTKAKQFRQNRKTVQAYLFRVQSRLNRGAYKGAVFLFNHMVAVCGLVRWEAIAASDQLQMEPQVLAGYRAYCNQHRTDV